MEKPKFFYQVTDQENSFIQILPYIETPEFESGKLGRFILKEDELKEYIEKYPNCCSLYVDDETEQEALRLYKKYNLDHL